MKKTETLTIRLDSHERAKLNQLAELFNVRSAGEVVRKLLDQVQLAPQVYDLVKRVNCSDNIDETTKFVTADELSDLHQRKIEIELLINSVALRVSNHVRSHGWPMPPEVVSLGAAVADLRRGGARAASLHLKSRFSSFWHAGSPGPVSVCEDPTMLAKLLTYRMGVNQSGEVWDVTFETIRRALTVQRKTVSWFQPKCAYDVYMKHLNGLHRPCVWDPSGGFGARMLGFYAARTAGIYCANEPARHTFADLTALALDLNSALFVCNQGSEFGHSRMKPESCDLVFTSPPYFDKEKYFDEPSQCWFGRDEKQWVNHYLKPTLAHALNYLKNNAKMILNVDTLEPYMDVAKDVGFKFEGTELLKVRRDHFAKRKNKTNYNEEYLITWRKN